MYDANWARLSERLENKTIKGEWFFNNRDILEKEWGLKAHLDLSPNEYVEYLYLLGLYEKDKRIL